MIKKLSIFLCSVALFAVQASQPPHVGQASAQGNTGGPVIGSYRIPKVILPGAPTVDKNTLLGLAKASHFGIIMGVIRANEETYKRHQDWINAQDEDGNTVLHMLVKMTPVQRPLFKDLIEQGMPVHPLFNCLLAWGADRTIKNNAGETVEALIVGKPEFEQALPTKTAEETVDEHLDKEDDSAPRPSSGPTAHVKGNVVAPVGMPAAAGTGIPVLFRAIITGKRAIDENTLLELAKGELSVTPDHEFEEVSLIIERNQAIYTKHPEWLNARNDFGDTILHILIKKYIGSDMIYEHDLKAFGSLLEQGVDYTIENKAGATVEMLTQGIGLFHGILLKHKKKLSRSASPQISLPSSSPASSSNLPSNLGGDPIDKNTLLDLKKESSSLLICDVIKHNEDVYKQHPEWLNTQGAGGDTILHMIVKEKTAGTRPLFKLLLECGADYTIANNDGETVESLIAGDRPLEDLLAERKADVEVDSIEEELAKALPYWKDFKRAAQDAPVVSTAQPSFSESIVRPKVSDSPVRPVSVQRPSVRPQAQTSDGSVVSQPQSAQDTLVGPWFSSPAARAPVSTPAPTPVAAPSVPLSFAPVRPGSVQGSTSTPQAQTSGGSVTPQPQSSQGTPVLPRSSLPAPTRAPVSTPASTPIAAPPVAPRSASSASQGSFLTPTMVGLGITGVLAVIIGKYYYDHRKAQQTSID